MGADKHQGYSGFLVKLAEKLQSYLALTMSPFHNRREHLRFNNPTFHYLQIYLKFHAYTPILIDFSHSQARAYTHFNTIESTGLESSS